MYEAIGRETGAPYDDYVVLEVPTGAGTGEVLLGDPEAITFQYYGHHASQAHGQRVHLARADRPFSVSAHR